MGYFIGVDIGGTFTDLVICDEDGRTLTCKTPSTPSDLSAGVERGLTDAARLLEMGVGELLAATLAFAHGTTVATNAFIERKGVATALLTTRGFGDTLRIQRLMGMTADLKRESLAHFSLRRSPPPLVPPERVYEIDERTDAAGTEVVALDEAGVRTAARALAAQGARAVAVCFLWSFLDPSHERRAGELLRGALPEAHVVLSSDAAPVLGEYERMATTVAGAYLAPPVVAYLARLGARLRELGLGAPLTVLNSSGGVVLPDAVASQVTGLLLSGPTGGLTASGQLADALGMPNVIASDMGGTSFDVGLIVDGRPISRSVGVVGQYHLATPMLAIETIGAGGGSIARVRDGYLSVGPESAGAEPGPACYGRGGQEPTVTDADLVLGILDPGQPLAGGLWLDAALARRAIERHVAQPMGLGLEEAAAAVRRIADSRMGDLLRRVTIERGFDPGDFVLCSYGGAGPSHCCAFAADLGLRRILVPLTATVHSAYGAAVSDITYSAGQSRPLRTPPGFRLASDHWDATQVEARFAAIEEHCRHTLAAGGLDLRRARYERTAELRFRRQTQTLAVGVPGRIDPASLDDLVRRFEATYERRFGPGSGYREAGIEWITCRVRAVVPRRRPTPQPHVPARRGPPSEVRPVYHVELGRRLPTWCHHGPSLAPGTRLEAPAIVHQPGTSILIAPGWVGSVDDFSNVWIERDSA